jgi:calcium-dependent protein kinase
MIIARQLSHEDVCAMQEQFQSIDTIGDGFITPNKFRHGMINAGMDLTEIEDAWDAMDTDKRGKVNYTEYIAASLDESVYNQRKNLMIAFNVFDKNGDGKISREDLK